jgi:predicted alpha/beta-hydrolase family hydrolase
MSPAASTAKPKGALLLTPGASADRNHSALVTIDKEVSELGIQVKRIDFNNRGTRKAEAFIGIVVDEVAALRAATGLAAKKVALGGRSMGGRICSMAVAGGLPALGLVLVSYPLHPPGKADQPRIAHLPDINVPCLFVSGTRDAFGTPAELEAAAAKIPGDVTHHWITGGDHGLRGKDSEVARVVADWLAGLLRVRRPRAGS